MISQEYYAVYPTPEAERPGESLDLGGGEGETYYFGLDKGISTMEMVAAVQHASARLDTQAALIDTQAALIAALTARLDAAGL
jgi:hypothetical protein